MVSSYTPNLTLEKPASGDQANQWGTTLNSNFDAIDTAIALKHAGTPQGNLAGSYVGQMAVDTANNIIYICTTSGNIATAVWTPSNLADASVTLTGDVTGTANFASGNVSVATTYATNPVPSGVISMFGGTSAPTGYLLCDGTAVSRTTYADLFTAIATNFGSGDGTSSFNLPNLQDRFPLGKGSTYSLNNTGGSSTFTPAGTNGSITPSGTVSVSGTVASHTLTSSQIPSHRHEVDSHDSNTSFGSNPATMEFVQSYGTGIGPTVYSSYVGGGLGHNHGWSGSGSFTGNAATPSFTGTNATSMPPYICVNYIIKT